MGAQQAGLSNGAVNRRKLERVLVVEDDRSYLPIWDYIVHKASEDSKVDWVSSVPEALRMIKKAESQQQPYSLIIADIFVAGGETGIDLWRDVHKNFHDRFVLVSSADHLNVNKLFPDEVAPLYLQKPFVISDAIGAVYELLNTG